MTITAPPVVLRLPSQFVRFAVVGVVNTGLFLVVYLAFRTVVSATAANLLATVLTTIIGTSANGRVTFGGAVHLRHHVKSMAVTGLGVAITTGAVDMIGADAGRLTEVAVLIAASTVAGAVRFLLMRHWVFGTAHPETRMVRRWMMASRAAYARQATARTGRTTRVGFTQLGTRS